MSISKISDQGSNFFHIIAKATDPSNHSLAISAADVGNDGITVKIQSNGEDLQLWQQRSTRGGDAYGLVNKKRQMCLMRASNDQGAALVLGSIDQIDKNDLAAWRDDNVAGTCNCINSYADWEQKINILGDGPYTDGSRLVTWEWGGGAPNELWVPIIENSVTTVSTIVFSLANANITTMTPTNAACQIVSNTTATAQSQTVTLTYVKGHSYSFENSTGLRMMETLEFKGGLPFVGEAKAAIEIEGTWSFKEGSETTEETSVSVEMPVQIPANSAVEADATLLTATLSVPYTATLVQTYDDGTVTSRTTSGTFTGVNTYTVLTTYKPAGVAVAAVIKERPLRRLG